MSLKDDFLEALRSVKRDFFKDYEPENATGTPPQAPPMREPEPLSADARIADEVEEIIQKGSAPFENRAPDLHSPAQASTAENASAEGAAPAADSYQASGQRGYSETARPHTPNPFPPSEGPSSASPVLDGRMILDDWNGRDDVDGEYTVISRKTIIRGAIQTEDSLQMFGQVQGDIDCRSNILVAGKVRGNTSAANAYVVSAQVDGNLLCDDVINVNDDAWILGNIRAQQAEIDGKIKGNIEIRHAISIGSNSSIIGNISTDELEIKRGAFLNGQVMMYSPSRDVLDRFDQFDQ